MDVVPLDMNGNVEEEEILLTTAPDVHVHVGGDGLYRNRKPSRLC